MVKTAKKQRQRRGTRGRPAKGTIVETVARRARDESEREMEVEENPKKEELDKDAEVDEVDNGNFPGASAASRQRLQLHQCEWCKNTQANYSLMCYVDRRTREFAEKLDQVYSQVVGQTQEYIRKFDTSEVDFV